MCMGEAIRTISFKVRTASCGGTACVNSFGDEQLAVDMLADKLLFEVRSSWKRICTLLSETHFGTFSVQHISTIFNASKSISTF